MILAMLVLAAAVDPLANRVEDKIDHPMAPYVLDPVTLQPIQGKPPVGKWFLDPSFGTMMMRLTGANPNEGANAVIKTMYSTVPAWNKGQTLMILWHRGQGHELYRGGKGDDDYRFIRNLEINPTDLEHVLWDPVEPLTFYYPTTKNQGRSQLIKVALGPPPGYVPVETLAYDFSNPPTSCPLTGNRFGMGKDPEANLRGRRLVGLVCGLNGRTRMTYSITEEKVLVFGPASQWEAIAITPTPSEQHHLIDGYVLDIGYHLLRRLTAASYFEHSMIGEDLRGDTWNTIAFNQSSPGANDAGTLVSHALKDGTRRVIIGPATGYSYIASGTHISATGLPGWVAVGSVGGARTGAFTGDQELMLANTDTGRVLRVGHNRTWAGVCPITECKWGYFGETHLVLGEDFRILFTSDWQASSTVDTYVLDLTKPAIHVELVNDCAIKSFSPLQGGDCKTLSWKVVP